MKDFKAGELTICAEVLNSNAPQKIYQIKYSSFINKFVSKKAVERTKL